jgi:AAA15 family ATPase/GTPase
MGVITINNFGPVNKKFEMNLDKKLTILIGEQATGKSTIARAVYYCILRVLDTVTDINGFENDSLKKHIDAVQKYFRRNYNCGEIGLNYNGENQSFKITDRINTDIPPNHSNKYSNFGGEHAIYIPAGRSTIPLLFESYAAAKNIHVDPFLDEFLLHLDVLRRNYTKSMQDRLSEALASIGAPIFCPPFQINEDIGYTAIDLINRILKGKYHYEKGNERIIHGNDVSTPITVASSGQQECLYILLTLFDMLFNQKSYTIIIEEPEAHLYPAAQQLFMELIALVIYGTGCRVIITTHSPYILTSANLLIHSGKVESKINNDGAIIKPLLRLNPDDVNAYMLERNGDFSYRSIMDDETGLIRAEEIDSVSDFIDIKMSELINLEVMHGL